MLDTSLLSQHYRQPVSASDRALIDRFIAEKGVRRFEEGLRVDAMAMKDFLESRGYTLKVYGTFRQYKYRKTGEGGPFKTATLKQLIALADEIRSAEGKTPILWRA